MSVEEPAYAAQDAHPLAISLAAWTVQSITVDLLSPRFPINIDCVRDRIRELNHNSKPETKGWEMDCVFCRIPSEQEIINNSLAKAFYDQFPVNPGHVLIIPSRHVASYFELTLEEERAMRDLLWQCRDRLDKERSPSGYNIGVNVSKAAGQTVFHVHIHLIPRYDGDVADPTGGIRNTIPGKGRY